MLIASTVPYVFFVVSTNVSGILKIRQISLPVVVLEVVKPNSIGVNEVFVYLIPCSRTAILPLAPLP